MAEHRKYEQTFENSCTFKCGYSPEHIKMIDIYGEMQSGRKGADKIGLTFSKYW